MAFLYGLAGVDLVAIIMGIFFAGRWLVRGQFNPLLGILSLTIAIPSAIIFAAGTATSGAWQVHPFAYWVMVVLFIPAGILHLLLLMHNEPESA